MPSLKEQYIDTDIKECNNAIVKILLEIEHKKKRIKSILEKKKELIKLKEGI